MSCNCTGYVNVECPECGNTHHHKEHYSGIKFENYCFSCNLWTEHMNNTNPNIVRISGHQYFIGKETNEPPTFRGFAGRKFLIKKNDSEEVITTTNLWHNGEIPEHFKERMPDNAIFVEEKK